MFMGYVSFREGKVDRVSFTKKTQPFQREKIRSHLGDGETCIFYSGGHRGGLLHQVLSDGSE